MVLVQSGSLFKMESVYIQGSMRMG